MNSAAPTNQADTGGAPAPVQCDSVSKWYGAILGIGDVTLSIGGGVTGLLGPNGAGKSTFMKLVTGQLQPSKGRVRVHGSAPWDNVALASQLGFAPEEDAFYDHLTPLAFVTALTRLHGFDAKAAATLAQESLRRVGLEDEVAHGRPLGACSRGMRQRAKFAQAIAHRPSLIVLDEPLNGVDPLSRAELIVLIQELGQAGNVVIVSSHVLYEVEAMTRNIILMAEGRLVADGDIGALRALIDEHPHTIQVTADGARKLAREVLAWDHVVSVRLEGQSTFTVETRAPDVAYDQLPRLARKLGARIRGLTSPDNNLAALFRYLVG